MRPSAGGYRPIMCFSRVDLPQPEPPRMTKTSPRRTSKATCSKIVRPSKRAARSSTRITVSASGSATAVTSPAGRTARRRRRRAPRWTRCRPPPRAVAASPTARGPRPAPSPARQPIRPMARPKTAALPQPAQQVPQAQRVLQLPGDPAGRSRASSITAPMPSRPARSISSASTGITSIAASSRGSTSQAIGSMPMMRSASTSSFTVMVPSSAAIGRAGAPGEDHRRHQRPELAQQRDADQVRDEDLGAEPAHRDGGLEGQDHPDQEAEQHGQPEGAQPGLVQVPHHLAEAQPPGPAGDADPGDQRFAEEGDLVEHPVAAPQRRLAEAAEEGQRRGPAAARGAPAPRRVRSSTARTGPRRQPLPPRRSARLALQPQQQHGAGGIEPGDRVEIEGERPGAPGAPGRLRPEPRRPAGIERAAENEAEAVTGGALRPRLQFRRRLAGRVSCHRRTKYTHGPAVA